MQTTEGSRLSALKIIGVLMIATLGCDPSTLKIDRGDGTGGSGGGSGGGTGVVFDPPIADGGSVGGGIGGGGGTGGGGTGGDGTGGGGTGGGSTGGGGTGGGGTGGGGTGGGAGGGDTGGGAGGTNDQAAVVVHTLPAQLSCGQATTITVTMRNVGDTTWTAAGEYRLGAVNEQDPFTMGTRIYFGPADSVAPGQEYTFNIPLVAPSAGTHTTDWRMVRDGVHWFGGTAARSVSVACTSTSAFYPCVIDGQFNMPAHEQRIASRNASLLRTGNVITGNDQIDNAVLGGGSPDGGIWLSGQFHFEIDANGQITSASWITVFSAVQYTVTGGVYPNGEIHMGSPAGLDISGIISGGMISGYVAEAGMSVTRNSSLWNSLSVIDRTNIRGIWHGDDLEYVHGLMSGTWVAR